VVDSIGSSSWKDLSPEDLGKSDAENIAQTGQTMVDALADIRAAQREIWDAYTQLDAELKTADLSTGQRQEKEAELKQLRTEITASAQASNMARMGFDQLLVSGGARGAEAFVKESVSQLADLAWDIASAPASAQSRQDLLDRADALATLLGNPGLAVDHFSNAYAQADALEQQGRLNDAEQIRAQATLDLLSMVAGGVGVAKAAVTALPKVAELGKIVAAGEKSVASVPKTGTVWDMITATQGTYEGTVVPKSFTLTTEGADIWVAPNATKHLMEYADANLKRGISADLVNIGMQSQLSSLQAAVSTVTSNGLNYGTKLYEGGWELMFSPPRQPGQLPVLYHALYKEGN
jgi:hypothetical protein